VGVDGDIKMQNKMIAITELVENEVDRKLSYELVV
jgi:hypothetical protein